MEKLLRLLALLLTLVLGGNGQAAHQPRSIQEEDIREAVFRFQFHPYPVARYPKPKVRLIPLQPRKDYVSPIRIYFLFVEKGKDPSGAFMKRFAAHKPLVKKLSQSCIKSSMSALKDEDEKTKFLWVRDKQTNEIGLIYGIRHIWWLSRHRVKVEADCYGGGRWYRDDIFTLTQKGKSWRVIRVKNLVVS